MAAASQRYGTYEKYELESGGRQLTRSQITEAAQRYLKKEGRYTAVG